MFDAAPALSVRSAAPAAHDGHRAPDAPVACASCGSALHGEYCHACGEKRLGHHDYSFAHFAEHAVDTVTHFDFKVVTSAWSLLRRPGVMTADVLAGRRVRWAKPLQLFLLINVLFFVVSSAFDVHIFDTELQSHISPTAQHYGALAQKMVADRVAERGITADAYAVPFDARGHTLAKSLVFLFIPLATAVLALLNVGRGRYVLEHVLVATHVMAGVLLLLVLVLGMLVALALLRVVGVAGGGVGGDGVATVLFGAFFLPFLALVFRRAYGDGWGSSAAKAVGFCAAFVFVLLPVYRFLLFVIAFALT